MKKITQLSFLILSFFLLGVLNSNAQKWVFEESSLSSTIADKTSETFTVDGVDLTVAGKMILESTAATIDGVNYSKGIYGDGDSSSDGTKIPTRRYISFPVKKGTINIAGAARSNSRSYSVMHVNASSAITELETVSFTTKNDVKSTDFNVTEDGTAYIYYKTGTKDIRFYSITFTPEAETNDPSISLTSGSTSQTVKQGTTIESVVYTWNEYANNAVVTWENDNALSGISITPNVGNKTVTIEGTVADAATAGTYAYSVYATDGANNSKSLTGTITVLDKNKKTIAFVSTSDDASSFNDPIYTHLSQSYNMVLVKSANGMDFTGSFYDMVIADERLDGSGDNGNLKAGFNKPFLNLKSFFYNSGRWAWGTADNGLVNSGVISVLEPHHPIYNGITISSSDLTVMEGALPEKTLQGVTFTTEYAGFSHNLAQVSNKAGDGNVISFHEIATGSTLGEITTSNKYIMLAISQTAVDYLNEAGLAIVKNACDYLMSEEVFGDENCTKKYTSQEITGFSVTGKTLTWNAIPATAKYKLALTPVTRSIIEDETTENSYTVENEGVYSASIIAINAAGTESQALSTSTFTITNTVGIEGNNTDKAIASVKYYSTTGIEMDENATGVVIVKTTYEDGSVNTTKSVKK